MRSATAFLLALAACTAAPARGQEGRIFRTVQIGFRQPVTLGQPLRADVRLLLEPIGEHRFGVRKGTFSDAQSITVETGADGTVRCMEFTYAPGFDYAASALSYERSLGEPASRTGAPADSAQTTRWQDPRTVFELRRQGTRVSSRLCDRLATSSAGGSNR